MLTPAHLACLVPLLLLLLLLLLQPARAHSICNGERLTYQVKKVHECCNQLPKKCGRQVLLFLWLWTGVWCPSERPIGASSQEEAHDGHDSGAGCHLVAPMCPPGPAHRVFASPVWWWDG